MTAHSYRSLSAIASQISKNWKPVNFAAVPYLQAMYSLDTLADSYGADDARSIVLYFLCNAGSWKGETAKAVKAELKAMLAGKAVKVAAAPAIAA